ncbi:N-acetylmuramoyl-L-alanine amidase [Caldanaerobius polysaccharolyticus]|uniref:N-acetylmuramoyl-L-alanine amidase n=1 Tax=Caldanaerobius polysaccharolyticus TaxID=44256 RepID=UPI00047D14F6|nr:N-acetylmuramoyl-L-alanine amidase [Caldanaerobius polysaccharolyticus]
MIVCIDAGHGGKDPGAVANGLREKDLTLDISLKLNNLLKNFEISTVLTRDKDIDVGLSQRAAIANSAKADFFISIHINAGGGSGFESYRHPAASQKTATIQEIIHKEIAKLYTTKGFVDRGIKTANYAVLRETKMPAILVENLFIDTLKDANFLKEEANRQAIAHAICNGIVQAFGIKAKLEPTAKQPTSTNSNTLYRVQVGAFNQKENAERLMAELKAKGYSAFIKEEK